MIKIVDNRGWQMTFPNGWTVSVILGKGAYCDNRGDEELDFNNSKPSPNAEIAAWDSTGKGVHPGDVIRHKFIDDTVLGWQKPLEILSFINMIANKDGPGKSVQDNDEESRDHICQEL